MAVKIEFIYEQLNNLLRLLSRKSLKRENRTGSTPKQLGTATRNNGLGSNNQPARVMPLVSTTLFVIKAQNNA